MVVDLFANREEVDYVITQHMVAEPIARESVNCIPETIERVSSACICVTFHGHFSTPFLFLTYVIGLAPSPMLERWVWLLVYSKLG